MKIPAWPESSAREQELLVSVLESPQWGGFHPLVAEFEQRFADFHQARHGISAFNGTVTLELALAVLGIGPGDEVIVPSISFVSTASAVSRCGAIPVFVDIGPTSFNIDPQRAAGAITRRTKAIIAVHFGAALANIDALTRICDERGLLLIEDAAHAHGAEWKHRGAGSFGITGSFSFQNGKVMCAGEGGMLISNDDEFSTRARSFANQGRRKGESFYSHYTLGSNLRMTGFQAAVLTAQLERLPGQIERRAANARLLKRLLEDLGELEWQDQPAEMTRSSWYLLCGRLRSRHVTRDEFHGAVAAAGLPCTPFYPHTLYQNPMYRTAPCVVNPCPNAEAYLQDAFWFHHRLLLAGEETIREAASVIRGALRGTERPENAGQWSVISGGGSRSSV
jgi:dTDP-4-amino-4,6-dideoxygalactose transaminase